MATDIRAQEQVIVDSKRDLFGDLRTVCLLALCITVLNMLWFSCDYHFPTQDEAEHIMNSIVGKDLLRHFHPWSHHWWYQVLTINCFYPPTAYMVNGFFMLILGQSRLTDQLSLTFFLCMAISSIYGIVRLLNGSCLAAALSACCLVLYPLINQLSHGFFLDLPEVAMTALSLMTLLWWRSSRVPKWKRTILTAFVLGISCLTKQLVAAYLLPIGLYYLITDIRIGLKYEPFKTQWILHTLCIGLITVLIGLPFMVINYQYSRDLTHSLVQDITLKHIHVSYIDKIYAYWQIMPQQTSILLLIIFFLALVFLSRQQHFRLWPIGLSALGGFLLTCTLPGFHQSARYLAPFLIVTAIYTGFLLAKFFLSPIRWQRLSVIGITIAATINCIVYNFVPYPWDCPQLRRLLPLFDHRGHPSPSVDWGYSFVIETIKNVDRNSPVYLNILTNLDTLHEHAFELLLKEEGNTSIKPTSARYFTIVGDKVHFTPSTALYSQWYLWKTGAVGYKFFDKESQINFNQLVEFVRYSGNFKLVAQKGLPDGSQLMLYRRK